MLRRLASTSLRSRILSRHCARPYSSDSGPSDAAPPPASESAPDANKKKPHNTLESLLVTLGPKGADQSGSSARNTRYSNFVSKGSSDNLLKGDYMGIGRSGRFGGVVDPMQTENPDPMHKVILHVHASSNNTILSLTDANGRVIVNASSGTVGFRKAQRAGFEPAYQATASIANTVKERGLLVRKLELRFKGFGAGRDAVYKAVNSLTNWPICAVSDVTPIPFNGCRPKKARRL
ncbi:hypothetical protein LPJ63_002573 [Coemansia sp. RSA 2711]|nr:hypothetical protein LPJ63_002573 [Coemansia sp. RSA 2711]KAJ1849702.1 hypothetical protein LPJ70_000299 [Coemansia sp. RSA 2708]